MSDGTAARNSAVIQLKEIKKSYGSAHKPLEILKGISFEVHRGEFLSITGASGAGKSTLLHILGCMDLPSSGHYYLDGKDVSCLSDEGLSSLRACSIGFVFQAYNVIPQLTVYENVEVPFLYQGQMTSGYQTRILESIEQVGLKHRLHHKPFQLSGGEIQRVAIARALAINPTLILADEPTGNLDSKTGKAIIELFHNLNQQGATIIIVTHNQHLARSLSRCIALYDGRIHNSGANDT